MKQCKCGGVITEHQLTKNREAWHCKSCGRYEIIKLTPLKPVKPNDANNIQG
jgi:hypothetical protein